MNRFIIKTDKDLNKVINFYGTEWKKEIEESIKEFPSVLVSFYANDVEFGEIYRFEAVTFSEFHEFNLDFRDYYSIIYSWHKKFGIASLPDIARDGMVPRYKAYIDLINNLPNPKDAKPECIALVFRQVIKGIMTWLCFNHGKSFDPEMRKRDLPKKSFPFLYDSAEKGIKSLSEVRNWKSDSMASDELFSLFKKSSLYKKFGTDTSIYKFFGEGENRGGDFWEEREWKK